MSSIYFLSRFETIVDRKTKIKKQIASKMASKNQKTSTSSKKSTVSLDVDDTGLSPIEINTSAIEELQARIDNEKKDLATKDYSVKMTSQILEYFKNYIANEVSWSGKEAIGVIEISKVIKEVEKEGIKNGYIYMKSLPLQASHYFISKAHGKGSGDASSYMDLYKVFDEALQRENQDSSRIRDLEKQLSAFQQGIDLA